jgi:hypothetical protein
MRLSPTANVKKEIATLTTVAASVRGSQQKNVDHYWPVVTKDFFAPLRAVPVEGTEVCGEIPSSDNNLDKGRPPPQYFYE